MNVTNQGLIEKNNLGVDYVSKTSAGEILDNCTSDRLLRFRCKLNSKGEICAFLLLLLIGVPKFESPKHGILFSVLKYILHEMTSEQNILSFLCLPTFFKVLVRFV